MYCTSCSKDVETVYDNFGDLMCSKCGSPIGVVKWKKKTFKLKDSTAVIIPKELSDIMGFNDERNPILIYYRDGEIVIKRDKDE